MHTPPSLLSCKNALHILPRAMCQGLEGKFNSIPQGERLLFRRIGHPDTAPWTVGKGLGQRVILSSAGLVRLPGSGGV